MKWSYLIILLAALTAGFGAFLQLMRNEIPVIYFFIILALLVLYAIADLLRIRKETRDSEAKHTEVINEITSLKGHDTPPDKSFPGFAIIFITMVEKIDDQRRKFIVDVGQESDRNRVSVYLDRKDNLVYRIFDDEGEPHLIKIPKRIHTFQLGTFYHFYCDYGNTSKYSYMRLFINNEELGKILFKEKLNLPEKVDHRRLGCDCRCFGHPQLDLAR